MNKFLVCGCVESSCLVTVSKSVTNSEQIHLQRITGWTHYVEKGSVTMNSLYWCSSTSKQMLFH